MGRLRRLLLGTLTTTFPTDGKIASFCAAAAGTGQRRVRYKWTASASSSTAALSSARRVTRSCSSTSASEKHRQGASLLSEERYAVLA